MADAALAARQSDELIDDIPLIEEQTSFTTRRPRQTQRVALAAVGDRVPPSAAISGELQRFNEEPRRKAGSFAAAGKWHPGEEPETVPGPPLDYWEAVRGDSPILAAVADRRLNAINGSCEAEGAFSKLKWVI
jgi:hypothetical protein